MEYRDLYTASGEKTGKIIEKHDTIPFNHFIKIVMVFIENSKGELLLQQRAKGEKWATTGGHPKANQNSIQGMCEELQEELGLTIHPSELTFFHSKIKDQSFVDLFYLKKDIDISSLTFQKEEVLDAKWSTTSEIGQMILDGTFFKYHIDEYHQFLNYISMKNAQK